MARRKLSFTYSETSDETDDYHEPKRRKTGKDTTRRRKRNVEDDYESNDDSEERNWVPLSALDSDAGPSPFEDIIEHYLPAFLDVREKYLVNLAETNHLGKRLRPLTISETTSLSSNLGQSSSNTTIIDHILSRKLKLDKQRRRVATPSFKAAGNAPTPALIAPLPIPSTSAPDPSIIDGLTMVKTTLFANSFAARLSRPTIEPDPVFLHRDWSTRSSWMDLMDDIHEHYSYAHPEREKIERHPAPIDYQILRLSHLPQVHELLARTFWPGIDVNDALQYAPESCTVVCTYKELVIGAAFLFSPQEAYITYLAVRAGWESSHVATVMLHTLLKRNPSKDILLHVSVNNPAMLLYNRFGFKAEEFIVGFYEDYLDTHSRASKNAFRLRLRQ